MEGRCAAGFLGMGLCWLMPFVRKEEWRAEPEKGNRRAPKSSHKQNLCSNTGGCRKASCADFLGGVCCWHILAPHSLGVQDSHSSRKASNTAFQAGVWERGGTAGV